MIRYLLYLVVFVLIITVPLILADIEYHNMNQNSIRIVETTMKSPKPYIIVATQVYNEQNTIHQWTVLEIGMQASSFLINKPIDW